MAAYCIAIVMAPLLGALIAGLFGRQIGRAGAHTVTIGGVAISTVLSLLVFKQIVIDGGPVYNETWYEWARIGSLPLSLGFLIDRLSATMMAVVSFVSLMVHIYTIGYMHDDPGYQRFFSYIALFTFSMLMLVMSNNFLQLFFGWEAVGLVSYLLIGFWFRKPTAIYASLKAFLANRVGDFGFLLGIALVLMYFGTLDYREVFANAQNVAGASITVWHGQPWAVVTLICLLLFVGAMGKSAQMPLHVWLPDSMEGPTPISALIHAATMVTAGIFMVARMSPLFELSDTALNVVMSIGALTAFLMGLLGLVQNDIKRVIAYSTLSQLGYMTVALGASAYSVAIFHLVTHAFFKALLFLAAGSVIIGLHHEQDMRHMGGLYKYMPITWVTSLIGSLALMGFPGLAGFYSKDAIIEAVHSSTLPAAHWAYLAVLFGVFFTALYSFRLFFMVFHGAERLEPHARKHLHESPAVVTVPLVLLALPSVVAGYFMAPTVFSGDFFGGAIVVNESHDAAHRIAEDFHGSGAMLLHGLTAAPTWLAFAGVAVAWLLYLQRPQWPALLARRLSWPYRLLLNKYGFDGFNEVVFAGGARVSGQVLWRAGDRGLIDGLAVNGSARAIGWLAQQVRRVQSGYLYHYAFVMILGMLLLLGYFVHGIGR
ncbi:MAG TPA: NADH-quinone oxidoreductase subunit L [Gammaproteobacteria bacterium]|nr:NADH-quinone oxidoreductase subunit L [Gammaproteobacteria bacterium]